MPFWKVQRSIGANATDGSAARDTTPNIEPVQVFATDRYVGGWVVATQERMTDVLNARETIRVCVDATVDVWETIDRDEILLVAPPERSTDPQRRIHRRKDRIVAQLGPYLVTGTVHLQPGISLDPYLLRTRLGPTMASGYVAVRCSAVQCGAVMGKTCGVRGCGGRCMIGAHGSEHAQRSME